MRGVAKPKPASPKSSGVDDAGGALEPDPPPAEPTSRLSDAVVCEGEEDNDEDDRVARKLALAALAHASLSVLCAPARARARADGPVNRPTARET